MKCFVSAIDHEAIMSICVYTLPNIIVALIFSGESPGIKVFKILENTHPMEEHEVRCAYPWFSTLEGLVMCAY